MATTILKIFLLIGIVAILDAYQLDRPESQSSTDASVPFHTKDTIGIAPPFSLAYSNDHLLPQEELKKISK